MVTILDKFIHFASKLKPCLLVNMLDRSGSGTCVRQGEDAGRVSVCGRVKPADPASEIPADVLDVVVPVDRHGQGVCGTHGPEGLAH